VAGALAVVAVESLRLLVSLWFIVRERPEPGFPRKAASDCSRTVARIRPDPVWRESGALLSGSSALSGHESVATRERSSRNRFTATPRLRKFPSTGEVRRSLRRNPLEVALAPRSSAQFLTALVPAFDKEPRTRSSGGRARRRREQNHAVAVDLLARRLHPAAALPVALVSVR
jgi:hypothetical protein